MSSQAPNDTRLRHTGRSEKILATGGLLAALAASSCCVVPLLLFGLGVSGAWIVHLTRLAPYHPYFIAAAAVCVGAGYWLRHRARTACTEGEVCARPLPNRAVTLGFIAAVILIGGALALDLIVPLFLSS